MVNQDTAHDPGKAIECKEKGNKCFQAGDWTGAESYYTQAIKYDPTNALLYTNLSMSLLKLQSYKRVITTSQSAISLASSSHHLHGTNMKAHFQLAQAQIALHSSSEALASALEAHKLCVEEIHEGGKGASSIGPITELVLRCKGEDWDQREARRLEREKDLVWEAVKGMEARRDGEIMAAIEQGEPPADIERREQAWASKVDDLRKVFERAGIEGAKRRSVPDWCVDDITFSVMVDPVVTRTGQSYDRSSIMEHLKRSPTDPLTREPLQVEDLRPNLALRAACEEFLQENGWAVDW